MWLGGPRAVLGEMQLGREVVAGRPKHRPLGGGHVPGQHVALVGTAPRLGLAEAWARGVGQPWADSLPQPRGCWQAVSKIKNRQKIPWGREGAGQMEAGRRQGMEAGATPPVPCHTPLSAAAPT